MSFFRPALALCALGLFASVGHTQTTTAAVSTVVAFSASNAVGSLARGADGALYGVTSPVTASGGLIYRAAPDGSSITTLYQLKFEEAIQPSAGLILVGDGLFYGTTKFGSSNETSTTGTVFRIAPDGTGFTVLHRFAPSTATNDLLGPINTDGAYPQGELVEGLDNYVYGTTGGGGDNGTGTIYRMKRDGSGFQKLYQFGKVVKITNSDNSITYDLPDDGMNPVGQLLFSNDGYLYGVTSSGGVNGKGVVYRINYDGTLFEKIHDFSATTTNTTTNLAENADGAGPSAGLADGNDGYLYGVAASGGAKGYGVVYRISPNGTTFKAVTTFDGTIGANPGAELTLAPDGKLYGTTNSGGVTDAGASSSLGTLFSLDPITETHTRLYSFDGKAGYAPNTKLVQLSSGTFAGTASLGGKCSYGTLYEYSASGATVDGNTRCGQKKNSNSGGGAGGPAFVLLLGALGLLRRRRAA